MRRRTFLYIVITLLSLILLTLISGTFDHLSEKSFDTEFNYPLDIDLLPLIEQVRNNAELSVTPINVYNYPYLTDYNKPCQSEDNRRPHLVIIVKSAVENFDRRVAIRQTWGMKSRFPDIRIRTVFILGIIKSRNSEIQQKVRKESRKHNDIIQLQYLDSYYNNTIKTMSAFKWAYDYCSEASNYLFSDDDMYVSIKNVFKYLKNPLHYPEDISNALNLVDKQIKRKRSLQNYKFSNYGMKTKLSLKFNDKNEILFAGFVFRSSPQRHMTSKWYTSLDEYPWDKWPPYVTAGAYLVSNKALKTLYAASHFVKHFKFDDIYLGIVAKKANIELFHCEEFYFYKKPYGNLDYRFVIASHGYHNPQELISVWNDQKHSGNA